MKNFIAIMFALLAFIVLPSIASAQPVPSSMGPYYVIERCYTVLFPYPHSRCGYVRVRRSYTPVLPPHTMWWPPMGPRHARYHPPPGDHGRWHRR